MSEDSSSREEEEVGLPRLPREMLDIRLSHEELGLTSFRSVDESLSDVQGLSIPCLLTELSREPVPMLSVAEGVLARNVLLRRIEVESRRSTWTGTAGVEPMGCEVGGRVGKGRLGETGERGVALDPGVFLLPGFIRYESRSEVPNASPAAAMPTVPTAQSYTCSQRDAQTAVWGKGYIYRGNVLLTVIHHAWEAKSPRGAAAQSFWLPV